MILCVFNYSTLMVHIIWCSGKPWAHNKWNSIMFNTYIVVGQIQICVPSIFGFNDSALWASQGHSHSTNTFMHPDSVSIIYLLIGMNAGNMSYFGFCTNVVLQFVCAIVIKTVIWCWRKSSAHNKWNWHKSNNNYELTLVKVIKAGNVANWLRIKT